MIESRFADTYWERLPGQAQDLVSRGVDIIVTIGTATVMVAKKATATIPIVMAESASRWSWDWSRASPIQVATLPESLTIRGRNSPGKALNC